MHSEHMKKLLFTIHPLFFNLTTQDAGKGRGVGSASRGASAGGGGQPGQDWPA